MKRNCKARETYITCLFKYEQKVVKITKIRLPHTSYWPQLIFSHKVNYSSFANSDLANHYFDWTLIWLCFLPQLSHCRWWTCADVWSGRQWGSLGWPGSRNLTCRPPSPSTSCTMIAGDSVGRPASQRSFITQYLLYHSPRWCVRRTAVLGSLLRWRSMPAPCPHPAPAWSQGGCPAVHWGTPAPPPQYQLFDNQNILSMEVFLLMELCVPYGMFS